jgi:1,4-dihydroxy-2-naphthoate polyprenyltransferase
MNPWIKAMRLRTLPLALASIIAGSGCAYILGGFQWSIFLMGVLTTVGLQILSNLANDYGDGIKGTDLHRVGEERMIQSGAISIGSMKKAIIICGIITLICGILTIYISGLSLIKCLLFLAIGICSIYAAVKYTMGENPYGYKALGDIAVFVFFGMVGVMGSFYLYIHSVSWIVMAVVVSMGALTTSVLHLNNMRDIPSDTLSNKNTVAIILGLDKSKWYFVGLMTVGMTGMMIYVFTLNTDSLNDFIFMLTYPFFIKIVIQVYKNSDHPSFDKFLKPTAIAIFFMSVLFFVGQLI